MVVITKIDICPPHILQQTIKQLVAILKSPGARKIPILIKNREECINTAVGCAGCPRYPAMLTPTTRLNSSASGSAPSSKCPTSPATAWIWFGYSSISCRTTDTTTHQLRSSCPSTTPFRCRSWGPSFPALSRAVGQLALPSRQCHILTLRTRGNTRRR